MNFFFLMSRKQKSNYSLTNIIVIDGSHLKTVTVLYNLLVRTSPNNNIQAVAEDRGGTRGLEKGECDNYIQKRKENRSRKLSSSVPHIHLLQNPRVDHQGRFDEPPAEK